MRIFKYNDCGLISIGVWMEIVKYNDCLEFVI